MRIVFRPWKWIFRKDWYGIYRWKNPHKYEGKIKRIIDIGAISIVLENRKEKS